jgi:hypothetical protein
VQLALLRAGRFALSAAWCCAICFSVAATAAAGFTDGDRRRYAQPATIANIGSHTGHFMSRPRWYRNSPSARSAMIGPAAQCSTRSADFVAGFVAIGVANTIL